MWGVLGDGEEIRACVTPLSYVLGKRVTTIEGLPAVWVVQKGLGAGEAARTLHPVQPASLRAQRRQL